VSSSPVLTLGRSLSNEAVVEIALAAFPELEGASSREVMRRACDVRDVLDGLPVTTVSGAERARAEAAARASGATR
jgi:hypothetical protein